MTTIEDIARDFTAPLREGQFAAAGDRYRARDISSIDPAVTGAAPPAIAWGKQAASEKCTARFVDLVDAVTSGRRPFSEIALFTVRDGQITEERFFHA